MNEPLLPPDARATLTIPAMVSFYLATLFVAVVWAAFTEPGFDLLLGAPADKAVPWWAAGAGTGIALVLMSIAAEPLMPSLRRLARELAAILQPITIPRVLAIALCSGIAEEALFRGPVQHSIGYVAASVVFALLHGGVSQRYIAWSTFALVAGLSFGLLADVYGSVWPPALAHVVVNGINVTRLGALPPEPNESDDD